MTPMPPKNIKGMRRKMDREHVTAIMDYLRPFKSRDPRIDCSEKRVADNIQNQIDSLRGRSMLFQYSQADGRKLIRLLRKSGYHNWADMIEQYHHEYASSWPLPART